MLIRHPRQHFTKRKIKINYLTHLQDLQVILSLQLSQSLFLVDLPRQQSQFPKCLILIFKSLLSPLFSISSIQDFNRKIFTVLYNFDHYILYLEVLDILGKSLKTHYIQALKILLQSLKDISEHFEIKVQR